MALDCVCTLILCLAIAGHPAASDCEVQVSEPWPTPYLFVPRDSTVYVNCTRRDESSVSWAILLPGDAFQYRSGDREFNDNGFYELPQIESPEMATTLRLLINDTSRNNGTGIICRRTSEATLLIIIFKPVPLELEISEVGIGAINVSWTSSGQSSAAASVAELNYSLTISYGSTSHLLLLNQSHHIFKAPPGSPPCQIYNFSVTATPVGATYTGDGCSVASFTQTMIEHNGTTDTTDVQGVTAIAVDAGNSFMVMCDFIPGSYARGCLVVLSGVHDNITGEVEQNSSLVLNALHPPSCYNAVLAFDIECDGSIESQPISGEIHLGIHIGDMCPTVEGTSASLPYLVIVGCVAAIIVVITGLIIVIVFVRRRCCLNMPDSATRPLSSCPLDDREVNKSVTGDDIHYAQPLGAVETSSHGPETTPHYQKTEHYQKEQQGSTTMHTASATDGTSAYAELNDEVAGNFYHTLESSRPPRGIVVNGLEHVTQEEGPPPYTEVSPLSPQATPLSQAPPLYHEIGEITKSISVPCSLGLKRLKSGNGITQSVADHQYATPSLCHLPSSEENGSESLV